MSFSFFAQAKSFKYNYKNINTLAGLICHLNHQLSDIELKANQAIINKFSITKNNISEQKSNVQIELSGSCLNKINSLTNEVISYGNNFSLEFQAKKNNKIVGTIGLFTVSITVKNFRPYSLSMTDPFSKITKNFNLKDIHWSKSNSIISFTPGDQIQIKNKGRVIATESGSNLKLYNTQYYNLWNFNSVGCKGTQIISEDTCQDLSEKI